jgi:hypothetical protein
MRLLPALLVAALLPLAACQTVETQAGACQVAPPPRSEERPKPPVSEDEQLWQPGHWDWTGGSYVWRPGAWILRASGSNLWMDGHWQRDTLPQPCFWVPAHWLG